MSRRLPAAADGAMGILVIVEPQAVAPIGALLASREVPASRAVLLAQADRHVPLYGAATTAIWMDNLGPGQSGVVAPGRRLSTEVLTACCFYHRWMDTKRRETVDAAIKTGMGALMVVADTVFSAAQIGRRVRQDYDIPLQVHEVSALWMSLSAVPVL